MRRTVVATLLALTLVACGEPAVPLEVPERGLDQQVLDLAEILDDEELARPVRELMLLGWDPVLVTFAAEDASLGMADRAGRKVLEAWGADLVLVAVGEPGDFTSEDPARQRFFGLFARDVRDVPRSVRERIVEQLVPPVAAENDWAQAFALALETLSEELGHVDGRLAE
jgi:hypothetical protein